MASTKALSVQQLAKALTRLTPKQRQSLAEILDKDNLRARRAIARREFAKGKVINEKELFRGLG